MARKKSAGAVRRYRAVVGGEVFEHEGSQVTHAVVAVAEPEVWGRVWSDRAQELRGDLSRMGAALEAPRFDTEPVDASAPRDVDDYASHRMRVVGFDGDGAWVAVNVKGHVEAGVPGIDAALAAAVGIRDRTYGRFVDAAHQADRVPPGPVLVGFRRGVKAADRLASQAAESDEWRGWTPTVVAVESV